MSIQESIKNSVLAGCSVTFPFKAKPSDWVTEVKIFSYNKQFVLDGNISGLHRYHDSLDDAVKSFCEKVFSKKNLYLALRGIEEHKLTEKELDDLSESQMRSLTKKYFREYYATDYPEFAE